MALPPPPTNLSDPQLFRVLDCMEAYLAAQEELAAALKDGLLDVARAKYALGNPGALGQQCYPGEMQAAAVLQPLEEQQQQQPSPSLYEQFQLRRRRQQQQQQCQGKQRAEAAASDSSSKDQAAAAATDDAHCQHHHSSAGDPIAWFSALPPAPLKSAQRHFSTALERAVAAAARVQQLRQLLDDLQQQQQEQPEAAGSEAVAACGDGA